MPFLYNSGKAPPRLPRPLLPRNIGNRCHRGASARSAKAFMLVSPLDAAPPRQPRRHREGSAKSSKAKRPHWSRHAARKHACHHFGHVPLGHHHHRFRGNSAESCCGLAEQQRSHGQLRLWRFHCPSSGRRQCLLETAKTGEGRTKPCACRGFSASNGIARGALSGMPQQGLALLLFMPTKAPSSSATDLGGHCATSHRREPPSRNCR